MLKGKTSEILFIFVPSMRLMIQLLQAIYSIYCMLVFVALMFVALPFVLAAYLLVSPKRENFIIRIATIWADIALFLWGMRHQPVYRASKQPSHAAIFVFNHLSYIDIPILLKSFRKYNIRVLGKAEIAAIPIFGFIYKSATIMVKRTDARDRAKSIDTLQSIILEGISIVIAPEGTFNMTNKPLKAFYDGAFRIAIETNTPIQPVVFLDAHDRLHYESIFSFSPGKSRVIFLDQVDPSQYKINQVADLKQKVYSMMENELIMNKASWIR